MSKSSYEVVVIGAGQSGLASGYQLQRRGRRFLIVEAGTEPTGSWGSYYESLRLFSPARFSSLPGLQFPGDPERYPTRDETIAYLKQYARHFKLPIEYGFAVESVERRADGMFVISAADGRVLEARAVVVATGSFRQPSLPQIEGQGAYRGQVLHSMDYREPASFAGKRVVVVGAANSAVQIGTELSGVAGVSLASRRLPHLMRQRWLGKDVHFWWWLLGLDTAPRGTLREALFRRLHSAKGPAVLDQGIYRRALLDDQPDVRPMFERFTETGVVWRDGFHEAVDAVIFATGFKPNLGFLSKLTALSHRGTPRHREGASTDVAGLYYVGLEHQRTLASATLRGAGIDAEIVARSIDQFLGASVTPQPQRVFAATRRPVAEPSCCI